MTLNTCLQGRWSDQHIMSNSSLSMEEKQKLVTGVGEWWMPYDDFTKCFTHLTICHPEPEPKERQAKVDWKEHSFEVPSSAGLEPVNYRNPREGGRRRVVALVLTREV